MLPSFLKKMEKITSEPYYEMHAKNHSENDDYIEAEIINNQSSFGETNNSQEKLFNKFKRSILYTQTNQKF